jgi:hypothetical protein
MLGQWCAIVLALGARDFGLRPIVLIIGILLGVLRVSSGFDLLIILKIEG